MADILINKFPGIAPQQLAADEGSITTATTAHNCNLFRGVVAPLAAPSFVEGGHSGEFVRMNGAWISGLTKPVMWRFGDTDMLFYQQAGQWYKRIGNAVAPLGLARPQAPRLRALNVWSVTPTPTVTTMETSDPGLILAYADYAYFVTLSRFVNGREIETAPTNPIKAPLYYESRQVPKDTPNAVYDAATDAWWDNAGSARRYFRIALPSLNSQIGVSAWNIYRSDNGDTPRLVATVPATSGVYDDSNTSSARGRSLYHLRTDLGGDSLFAYVCTWERVVGTQITESGPSTPVQIGIWSPGVEVFQPVSPPTGAVAWNIYRISLGYDPTVSLQLVARVDIGVSSYSDSKQNAELGSAITTSYTNAQGVEIAYQPPSVAFDGMAGPHQGMMFGWKGSTLYWSAPGEPDAWPEFYTAEAFGVVKNCVSIGTELLVFTSKGVQRGVGTDGDSFFLAQFLSGEGCVGHHLVDYSDDGVFYMSNRGIVSVTAAGMTNITKDVLGPDYFDSIDLSSAHLRVFLGAVILFHSGGAVRFDIPQNSFTTHSGVFSASFSDKENSRLVLRSGTDLVEYLGSEGTLEFDYTTGDIVLRLPEWKAFDRIEFFGKGTITASAIIDETELPSYTLDLDGMLRDRVLLVPHGRSGRALRVRVRGTGLLYEIRVSVTKVRV